MICNNSFLICKFCFFFQISFENCLEIYLRLYKERSRHPSSYDDILYNSPILQVPDAPTSDECRFVCSIINIISRQTSPTSDQQI